MRGGTLIGLAAAFVLATCAGGSLVAYRALQTRKAAMGARASASHEAARHARITSVVGEVAPGALPKGFPLLGAAGTFPDGYPTQTVDRVAIRSLLWHKKYADLSHAIAMAQDAFEKDAKKEYWILDALDAFASAEPELTKALDAWVAAEPKAFAPYLCRATHFTTLAMESRGGAYVAETDQHDLNAMDQAFRRALLDLAQVEALRPDLMATQRLRLRMEGFSGVTPKVDFAAATRTCPSCYQLRVARMIKLKPRWGGGVIEMQQFAARQIKAHGRENPRMLRLQWAVLEDKAELLNSKEDYATALAVLEPAFRGDAPGPHALRGALRAAMGDHLGALSDFDARLKEYPQDAEALVARAQSYSKLDKPLLAGKDLLVALRINPTVSGGRWTRDRLAPELHNRALQLHEAGRRVEAVEVAEVLSELAPTTPTVSQLHYHVVLGLDPKRPGAEDELRAAVAHEPASFRAVQHLDYFLTERHRFDLILPFWDTFIAQNPDEPRAYLERSGTHHQLGHHLEAQRDAQRACEMGLNEGCLHAH